MISVAPEQTRTLIDELLAEQQRTTPIERFARLHEQASFPAQAKYYHELLPARTPEAGEQYAFAVDLDECTGCMACVAACHNLNGLDEDETWRNVGVLHGCSGEVPVQQTVTTACHHCVEPACLEGCPVLAYEKDSVTGIVRHLDDQCIGCQYCILKCPYDVPKYSSSRGIVRKCDMCTHRLAVGEAPACAQACPNGAISITIVNRAQIVSDAHAGKFLPGSPAPDYTVPATQYRTRRYLSANLAPADRDQLKPEPPHTPLAVMLVLTQLSVGAFCLETLLRLLVPQNLMTQLSFFHSLVAFALGLLALGASVFHLGRPLQAWRAVLGFKTSWLSREILVFSLFAFLATLHAALSWFAQQKDLITLLSGASVSFVGLAGVFCSLMLYRDTRRAFWSGRQMLVKFFGTAGVLGTATLLFLTTLQTLLSPGIGRNGAYHQLTNCLAGVLALLVTMKLGFELTPLRHLWQKHWSPEQRTARLMMGELRETTTARFMSGIIGGIVMPLAILARQPAPGWTTLGLTIWLLAFVVLGEMLERRIFFCAVAAPKMPGML
jgi:formate dehydrogenase iron-sulfur subunit